MRLLSLFKHDLAEESKLWVAEGLIQRTQAEAICKKYDVDYDAAERKSFGYLALLALGYLFIGIAVILLISANWESIPRAIRMASLIIITSSVHFFGLRSFAQFPQKGTALFFLGSLLYGASIILIAQMYHLGEHMPDGVFWWAVGILPFVWLTKSNWLMMLPLALSALWFGMEQDMGFYQVGFIFFILFAFYGAFKWQSNLVAFIASIISTAYWIEGTTYGIFHFNIEELWLIASGVVIGLYGIAVFLAQNKSPRHQAYAALLQSWCLRFIIFTAFLLTFKDVWRSLLTYNDAFTLAAVAIGLASAIFGYAFSLYRKRLMPVSAWFALFSITVLVGLFAKDLLAPMMMSIIFNIIFISIAVYLIIEGVDKGITHYFFLGVISVLAIAFARYINLIGDYIGAAILFMVLAGVLLAAAKYWRKKQIKQGEVT